MCGTMTFKSGDLLSVLCIHTVQQLTGQQATPDHAALLLDDYFASAHDTTTVLLADEVKHSFMYGEVKNWWWSVHTGIL